MRSFDARIQALRDRRLVVLRELRIQELVAAKLLSDAVEVSA